MRCTMPPDPACPPPALPERPLLLTLLLAAASLLGPAAPLGAQSSSPLDRLNPKNIPALERFDWQPKELVAVLGEHRGRQGASAMAVAFSPDGKVLASAGANGIV